MEASGGWQRGMMRHHANSCHSLVQARQPRAAFALAASGRSSSLARAGGVGGGKRPARGQRHGEQESSSASLTAELRVMVLAAPPLPGHCGERSNVSEECIRRGKPAESSCSPQNLQLLPRVSGWKRRRWLVAYQGWYLCWQWMCRFPAASPFAGGGWRVAVVWPQCQKPVRVF